MSKAVLVVEGGQQLGESLKTTILSLLHHEPHHILTLKEAIDNQRWDVLISDYSLAD